MPPPSRPPAAPTQSTEQIAATLEAFLAEHPQAAILEDGRLLFDLRTARFSLSTEHNRCTLHLWNEDRNLVRRILAASERKSTLRLVTQRFGQAKPSTLEVVVDKDRRTPSTREATRTRFLRLIERVLPRHFPDFTAEAFRTAMDLEHSFGPAYARGSLYRGQQAWAVIAVNEEEPPATIDGILTLGILWLQHCRDSVHTRHYVGLKLILPTGTAALTLARLAWLNHDAAQWELYELNQAEESLELRDPADHGNLATHLLHAPNQAAARERFAEAAAQVMALVQSALAQSEVVQSAVAQSAVAQSAVAQSTPAAGATPVLPPSPPSAHPATSLPALGPGDQLAAVEQRLRSPGELAFLLHGLEFARARLGYAANSFNQAVEITFGTPSETPLTPDTEPLLRDLVAGLFARRHPGGDARDPLFRLQPERWLESILRQNLQSLDPHLDPRDVYTQVPAFAASDRGLLDLLAVTQDARLAVIELKANEDLHLALQGLDYWIRVRWHHTQNPDPATGLPEFQRHGYFPGHRLSPADPRLFLVAPALRIHPATETILRFLSPRVDWMLLALDERWRHHIKVVWRKRTAGIDPFR